MPNENEKWVSCHRGMFPDVPVPLSTDGTYSEAPVTELIVSAQQHCGQECPPTCGFRHVTESLKTGQSTRRVD